MLPYQAMAMDYAVSSSYPRQSNVNPAFTHSWFVPAEVYPFKQSLLEPGILELRKEKSRDAARSRRGKENFEFYELAKMLPLPAAITSQLDKASIIRLTIAYLKLRDFSGHGDPPWSRDGPPPNKTLKGSAVRPRSVAGIAMEMFEQHQGTHILQSLDGFAFALAADGRFLYISETVSIYLGLSQVEMTGSSVFDYIHHQDHQELAEQLGLGLAQGQSLASPSSAASDEGVNSTTGTNNPDVATLMTIPSNNQYKGMERSFCIRMKSTLTKRGCHFKSSGYRVVLVLCRLRPQYTFSHSRKSTPPLLGMVALAMALPPPSVHEIRLESDMFVTRINFDFRIAHCEPRMTELLDYSVEELTGRNLYSLCHGEDVNKLRKSHMDLISKGQSLSPYYRIMNKNGGYTWLQTCATVVCNSKNADEQNIICVNYVITGKEYENLIMDCCQLEDSGHSVKREDSGGNDRENGSPDADLGRGGTGRPGRPQDPHHSSPDHLDDASSEGPRELHGGRGVRGHITADHVQAKKLEQSRKRKLLIEENNSCCSSEDEDDKIPTVTHCNTALSPASSSSCQSSVTALGAVTVPSPKSTHTDVEATTGTSVKDLEHAMSKHLPCKTPPTDFSTDALLKQQQQRSTIQWIGAHHHHLNQLNQQQTLPASALLRQLYANRESVIRANVGRTGSGSYYATDVNQVGPLPTPPGSEGSSTTFGDTQFALAHGQKCVNGDTFNSLYTTGGGYSVDYHSAMTPPSSVSPRDNPYPDILRHQYLTAADSPAQPLPLKPQVYSLEQTQFYGHHTTGGGGFHLYHPATNKSGAMSSNWYSAPS